MRGNLVAATLMLLSSACSDSTDYVNEEQVMAASNPLATETYSGHLRGLWADEKANLRAFMGIPYARPPLDALRWQPPQAPLSWQGERDATEPGAACWQNISEENFVWARGDFERSEDCLFLNVFGAADQTSQMPVMVWFHGGSHTAGMGHDPIFDGTELARLGVVVVTVNYRLGAFGFLAHPALVEESDHDSAGNYGLLDKIAALNWVRDNIGQFGGDATNITIFGQSAGSQSVCALMASPLAQGLFHKAIGQSAACVDPLPKKDSSGLERGHALVEAMGSGHDLVAMRSASPQDIRAAATASNWELRSKIVTDGWVLPDEPDAIFARGEQAHVPLLLGSLSNEGHLLFPLNESLTRDQLDVYLTRSAGDAADKLLSLYASALNQSPGMAQWAIATDMFMTYGMRRWASYQANAGQSTYLYYLDHKPPAFRLYVPDRPDLELVDGPRSAGAYHSGDLAYVFANTRKVGMGWQEEDHALAAQIARYWTNFAKNGDPNDATSPKWQPFNTEGYPTMRMSESQQKTVAGIQREAMDLWDARFGGAAP